MSTSNKINFDILEVAQSIAGEIVKRADVKIKLDEFTKGLTPETLAQYSHRFASSLCDLCGIPHAQSEEQIAVAGSSFTLTAKIKDKERIKVIKEVRAFTGLGLKEAKEIVDDLYEGKEARIHMKKDSKKEDFLKAIEDLVESVQAK